MADSNAVEMKPTLGLTGLTMNAMVLIAPGAFLDSSDHGSGSAVDATRHHSDLVTLSGHRQLLRGAGKSFRLLTKTAPQENIARMRASAEPVWGSLLLTLNS